MHERRTAGILLLIVCASRSVFPLELSNDTLRLDLRTAERRLLQSNLLLVAQKFTLNEHEANVRQAGLWDNPNVSYEQSIYNRFTGSYFPTGENGQFALEIRQPLALAGRRSDQVNVERVNTELAAHDLDDLRRSLLKELRSSFYELHFSQLSLDVYDREIAQLRSTVDLFEQQFEHGNISGKDIVRLKALLLSLEDERKDLFADIVRRAGDVSLLVGDSSGSWVVPSAGKDEMDSIAVSPLGLAALIDSAMHRRADVASAEATVRLEEENLSLQHALAIPDVRLGFAFDKNGSYIPDYTALTLEVDLPLFNRNQGSIEAAEYRVGNARSRLLQFRRQVESEVRSDYTRAAESDRLYRTFDAGLASDFENLIGEVVRNYEKQNIGLLEFIDFFESYKSTMVQLNHLQSERIRSIEELNFAAGIFSPGE